MAACAAATHSDAPLPVASNAMVPWNGFMGSLTWRTLLPGCAK
jgi:hypothetical protein